LKNRSKMQKDPELEIVQSNAIPSPCERSDRNRKGRLANGGIHTDRESLKTGNNMTSSDVYYYRVVFRVFPKVFSRGLRDDAAPPPPVRVIGAICGFHL